MTERIRPRPNARRVDGLSRCPSGRIKPPVSVRLPDDRGALREAMSEDRYYSVTTIIGALDKPALLYWAAEQTALAAVRMAGSLGERVKEEGQEAVVRYLRDARFRPPPGQVSATDLGTAVHDAVERYVKEGKRPDVGATVLPYLEQFDRWAQVWQPEYRVTEAAVYSPRYKYAGTLDAICTIEGCKVLVDYKSSRRSVGADDKPSRPYPEAALQLAAYRHAELLATAPGRRTEVRGRRYYLFGEEEATSAVPMPTLDGSVVVHITPEHCDMYPVRSDDRVFEAFLYTVEAFRWQQELSKQVIGKRSTKEAEDGVCEGQGDPGQDLDAGGRGLSRGKLRPRSGVGAGRRGGKRADANPGADTGKREGSAGSLLRAGGKP